MKGRDVSSSTCSHHQQRSPKVAKLALLSLSTTIPSVGLGPLPLPQPPPPLTPVVLTRGKLPLVTMKNVSTTLVPSHHTSMRSVSLTGSPGSGSHVPGSFEGAVSPRVGCRSAGRLGARSPGAMRGLSMLRPGNFQRTISLRICCRPLSLLSAAHPDAKSPEAMLGPYP